MLNIYHFSVLASTSIALCGFASHSIAESYPVCISANFIGSYDTPGQSIELDVVGTTAYMANNYQGLSIIDIGDPTSPTLLGSIPVNNFAREVVVQGTIAYVASANAGGLRIIDVSDPTNPTDLSNYDTPGEAEGIAVVGPTAYIADKATGLLIIDVSDPNSPTLLGSYDTPFLAIGVDVVGTIAYVTDDRTGN